MGDDKKTCSQPNDCKEGVDLSQVEPALDDEPYKRSKPKKDWLKILKVRPGRRRRRRKNRKGISSEEDDSDEKKKSRSSKKRSGKASKKRSGKASKKRSGKASKNKSGKASKKRSGKASKKRSGKASKNKSGKASKNKSGKASKNRSGKASKNKSGKASKNRSGKASKNRSGKASKNRSGKASKNKSGKASKKKSRKGKKSSGGSSDKDDLLKKLLIKKSSSEEKSRNKSGKALNKASKNKSGKASKNRSGKASKNKSGKASKKKSRKGKKSSGGSSDKDDLLKKLLIKKSSSEEKSRNKSGKGSKGKGRKSKGKKSKGKKSRGKKSKGKKSSGGSSDDDDNVLEKLLGKKRSSGSRSGNGKKRGSKSKSKGSSSNEGVSGKRRKAKAKKRRGKGSDESGSLEAAPAQNFLEDLFAFDNSVESGSSESGSSESGSRRKDRKTKKRKSKNKSKSKSKGKSRRNKKKKSEKIERMKAEVFAKLRGQNKEFIKNILEKKKTGGGKKNRIRKEKGWKKFTKNSDGNDAVDEPQADERKPNKDADRDWIKSADECVSTEQTEGKVPVIKGDGFKLNKKSGKCQDINECRERTHKCPKGSKCKNTIGSYTCQCKKGNLVEIAGKMKCEGWATCRGSGDPHYFTFDGIKIDYMGTCTYTLVKPCPTSGVCNVPYFNVEVKNWHKPDKSPRVSFARYVLVKIGNSRIQLGPGRGNVYISKLTEEIEKPLDGGEWVGVQYFLPVTNHPDLPGVEITQKGRSMLVQTDFLRVEYDGDSRVSASIPSNIYKNIGMCGLCGNFNGKKDDDLVDRYGEDIGELELGKKQRFAVFGDTWRVVSEDWSEGCKAPQDNVEECPTEMAREQVESDSMCGMISNIDGPFADCIGEIMTQEDDGEHIIDDLVDNCFYDLCMDYENKETELCDSLAEFADICRGYGVDVHFRTKDFCPMACGENMVYQPLTSACPRTCANPKMDPSSCTLPDVEGCVCKKGLVLSGDKCVKPEQCGCMDMDRGYVPVDTSFMSDDCKTIRTCQIGGNFHESPGPKCHPKARCAVRKGVRGCHCKRGWRNGNGVDRCDDEDECALGTHRCAKDAVCINKEGTYECACNVGFAGDGKICIAIPDCADGSRRNSKGECVDINECKEMENACGPNARCYNQDPGFQCACKRGKTGDPYSEVGCHSACVCKISGDPHFETCDGLAYDFQGRCKYTAAKPCGAGASALPNFQVDVKNQRWRRSTTSRVQYVDVKVCNYVVRLHQGNRILLGSVEKRAPLFLECDDGQNTVNVELIYQRRRQAVLLTTNFGLSVQWDGHWDVRVKVPDMYEGKMCGLCGNYDGKPENDPKIKDGGLDKGEIVKRPHDDDEDDEEEKDRSPVFNKFGESWRVGDPADDQCESDDTAEPVCTKKRFKAAKRICKVLSDKRGEFSMCVEALGKRAARAAARDCAFDYCMTPDDIVQETLCSDFEEYVAACEDELQKSLDFDWRKNHGCPSMCPDPDMEFQEDVSGCPKTCDDPTGTVGCTQPKRSACVCKNGMVLLGDKCVDVSSCSCVDDMDNFRAAGESWITANCEKSCSCTIEGEVCEAGPTCAGDKQSCGQDQFGVWGCVCQKGFEMNSDGECENIDECHRHLDNCHPNAKCKDKSPGFGVQVQERLLWGRCQVQA
ncbi:IgGFc-binding protein-like isoform X3 [Liolophura sinensis]|uniref:IgGFc-binding protein-like isoform X3 n=1 Tax=Liolophura sinensis TaxID=3198878 RepID=UPI003158FA01